MRPLIRRLFRRRQTAWWTLAIGLAITAALGWELHRQAVALDRTRMGLRAAEITAHLDTRLEKSEMLLHNLRDYLTLTPERRDEIFDRWCYENGLTINCPWIHGILLATNRYHHEWPPGVPKSPKSWTKEDWNRFNSFARAHPIECHIALRTSLTNTKQFLTNYDLSGSITGAVNRFARIVTNSRLGMSRHQTVMLDSNHNAIAGTTFLVPIYKPAVAGWTADLEAAGFTRPWLLTPMRWINLTEVIVAPVDFHQLVQSVWDGHPADLGIELFSSTNQTAETILNPTGAAPRAADSGFSAYLTHRQLWPMYGAKFSIFFHTTPLFEAQSPRRLANVAMAAGAGLTLLATALVGVTSRARTRQESLTEQIREARDALRAAQEERSKISRDLHDGTIQWLYAIQLGLGHTAEQLDSEPGKARKQLTEARRELDGVIAEIRHFITMEAGEGKRVDFRAVLQALVQRGRTGTTAQIDVQCDGATASQLDGNQSVHLANFVREALSNSLRHGQPCRITVKLFSEQGQVCLEIEDDGAGFDPDSAERSGLGLPSLAARAQEVGGKLVLKSSPGHGTCVSVRIPMENVDSEPG